MKFLTLYYPIPVMPATHACAMRHAAAYHRAAIKVGHGLPLVQIAHQNMCAAPCIAHSRPLPDAVMRQGMMQSQAWGHS